MNNPEASGDRKEGGARLRGGNRKNYQSSASLFCLCWWREGKGFGRVYNMKTEEPKREKKRRLSRGAAFMLMRPLCLSAAIGDQGWLGRSASQRSYSSQGANAVWTRKNVLVWGLRPCRFGIHRGVPDI